MQTTLCVDILDDTMMDDFDLKGIIRYDWGSQYSSHIYCNTIAKYNVIQSMNSDAGNGHDNVCCDSMWAHMKSELFYGRYDTSKFTKTQLKV